MKLKLTQREMMAIVGALMVLFWGMWTEKMAPAKITQPTPLPTVTATPVALGTETQTVKVVRVVDGDTIELEGGAKLRYIGIDTPETSDPRKPVQCFGKEAAEKNRTLVEGKEVRLEKDVSETDRYGRLLRYVYVGDEMINETLVKEGYAQESAYPPDVKHQEKFRSAETAAKNDNLGLWGGCP